MLFRFFPQEFKFFDLLEEQADQAVAAAVFFKEVVTKGELTVDDLSKMRDIEHRGDEAAHAIIDRLNRTFVTPFDREDIYARRRSWTTSLTCCTRSSGGCRSTS